MSNASKKQQKTAEQPQAHAKPNKAQKPKGPKPDYTPKKKVKSEAKKAPQVKVVSDKRETKAPFVGAIGMALTKACQDAGTAVQYRKTQKPEQEQRKPRPEREAHANKTAQRREGKPQQQHKKQHPNGNKKPYAGKQRSSDAQAATQLGVIPVKAPVESSLPIHSIVTPVPPAAAGLA